MRDASALDRLRAQMAFSGENDFSIRLDYHIIGTFTPISLTGIVDKFAISVECRIETTVRVVPDGNNVAMALDISVGRVVKLTRDDQLSAGSEGHAARQFIEIVPDRRGDFAVGSKRRVKGPVGIESREPKIIMDRSGLHCRKTG